MRQRNTRALHDYIRAITSYEIAIKVRQGIKYRVRIRVDYGKSRKSQELYPDRVTLSKGIRNPKKEKDVMSIDLSIEKSSGKCHPPYRCTYAVAWKLPTLNDLIPHDLWGF